MRGRSQLYFLCECPSALLHELRLDHSRSLVGLPLAVFIVTVIVYICESRAMVPGEREKKRVRGQSCLSEH